jgi:mRNA-degrading endonuclease RelE of RelBE toxin-antitoxin system
MKITRIEVSSRFKRSFRKLPSKIQRKAILKTKFFKENPFDPRLRNSLFIGKRKRMLGFLGKLQVSNKIYLPFR